MESTELQQSIRSLRKSAKRLASSTETERNQLLQKIGGEGGLHRDWQTIKVANEKDIVQAKESGREKPWLNDLYSMKRSYMHPCLGWTKLLPCRIQSAASSNGENLMKGSCLSR